MAHFVILPPINYISTIKAICHHFNNVINVYNITQGLCSSFKISSTYIFIESLKYKNKFKKLSTLSYTNILNGLYRKSGFTNNEKPTQIIYPLKWIDGVKTQISFLSTPAVENMIYCIAKCT